MSAIPTIEVVRGQMGQARADELLAFWEAQDALTGAEAQERLAEVVCVLRDEDGAVAGACSVYAADVPIVGGRRFWVFRSLLPGSAAEQAPAMIRETFGALEAAFVPEADGPIGLCVLVEPAERSRRPEVEWSDPRMIYAGYLGDGRQVRIAYFEGALVGPGEPNDWGGAALAEGYRIELFAEQDDVSREDVIELWVSEGVLPQAEAERRVDEVLLVATDDRRRPVGISSAYLQRNEQLGMDLWYYRAFVARAHRMSAIAVWLAVLGRDHLERRFVSGADARAGGLIYEVENETLRRHFPQARWMPTDFLFVDENERGAHVRVRYFPGARAPEPPQGSA